MDQRWWAFDRPVLRDPLLWVGLATGLGLVVLSPPASSAPWYAAAWDVVVSVLAGVVLAGVFGGFVRNLLRALEDRSDDPGEGDRR